MFDDASSTIDCIINLMKNWPDTSLLPNGDFIVG